MSYYGTLVNADAYHLARGNADWAAATTGAKEAALTVSSDYTDSFRALFPGKKTGGRAQEREWPRIDPDEVTLVVDKAGEDIPSDEVPVEAENATYEGALLIIQGISLTLVPTSATAAGTVIRKRVKAGPVESETQYSTETTVTEEPSFQKIMDALENILSGVNTSGAAVALLRA